MLSEHPKRAREAALGFHQSEGAGGVVGILATDCLNGTHREPDRYLGSFEIFSEQTQACFSLYSKSDLKSKTSMRNWKNEEQNADNNSGWNEFMSEKLKSPAPLKKKEILRAGCLKFKERVLYKTNLLLSIPFKEVPREELMTKISDQYIQLQVNIKRIEL